MNAEIDITNVVLHTDRLTLRPWRMDDLEDFFSYASVDGVGEMAGWRHHENRNTSRMILQEFIEGKHTFALEYQNTVIGSLGIEKYNEKRFPRLTDIKCCEIGYVLAKDFWGRGLMPEAVNCVLEYLFVTEKLDAVLCGHFHRNEQSASVQRKCGFHYYANGLYETQMGTVETDIINILRKEEWEEQHRTVF